MHFIIASESRGRGFNQFLQKVTRFLPIGKYMQTRSSNLKVEEGSEIHTEKHVRSSADTFFLQGSAISPKKSSKHMVQKFPTFPVQKNVKQLFNILKVRSKRLKEQPIPFNIQLFPEFPFKNSKNINSKGDLCKAFNFLLKTSSLSK